LPLDCPCPVEVGVGRGPVMFGALRIAPLLEECCGCQVDFGGVLIRQSRPFVGTLAAPSMIGRRTTLKTHLPSVSLIRRRRERFSRISAECLTVELVFEYGDTYGGPCDRGCWLTD
jgi:hypothetical protein